MDGASVLATTADGDDPPTGPAGRTRVRNNADRLHQRQQFWHGAPRLFFFLLSFGSSTEDHKEPLRTPVAQTVSRARACATEPGCGFETES